MNPEVKAKFKRERECKHSVRYIAVDAEGENISSVIYINKTALKDLNNPAIVTVTIS